MSKIKVGVVGTGFIGPAHIEALRRLPNIEVVALCEANAELANSKAAQLGIDRACVFDELLAMKISQWFISAHLTFYTILRQKRLCRPANMWFVKNPWRKTCTKQKSL